MRDIVKALTILPSNDGNFISAINKASIEDLEESINIMESRNKMDKGRLLACQRRLRKIGKEKE